MSEVALPGQTKKTGVGDAAVVRTRANEGRAFSRSK